MSISELWFSIHYSSQTEISNLDITASIEKNVSGFKISVKNFCVLRTSTTFLYLIGSPPVAMMQSHGDLSEEFPYNILSDRFIWLFAQLYNLSEIPLLAVFHYYVDLLIVLVDDAVIVSYDMGMIKLLEDIDLWD